jgi:hypothetical protein
MEEKRERERERAIRRGEDGRTRGRNDERHKRT